MTNLEDTTSQRVQQSCQIIGSYFLLTTSARYSKFVMIFCVEGQLHTTSSYTKIRSHSNRNAGYLKKMARKQKGLGPANIPLGSAVGAWKVFEYIGSAP